MAAIWRRRSSGVRWAGLSASGEPSAGRSDERGIVGLLSDALAFAPEGYGGQAHNGFRSAASALSGGVRKRSLLGLLTRREFETSDWDAVGTGLFVATELNLEVSFKVQYDDAMDSVFTIGQLARTASVPVSTVRYYERMRLLRPDGRTGGNYRVYSAVALERLRFIRAAQANGFTLDDIVALLDFRDGKTAPCQEVQELIKERLADLEKRVEELHQVRAVLRSSLVKCRQTQRSGKCQVIEKLKAASTSPIQKSPCRSRSKNS